MVCGFWGAELATRVAQIGLSENTWLPTCSEINQGIGTEF